jgi:hypothetical protein
MRSRTIGIGLAVALCATAIASTALKARDVQNVELSAPNTIESLPCVIKNSTNKYITAAAIAISITTEKQGRLSADLGFLTIETFLHPDFREEYRNNLIPPGGESPVEDLPSSYDDAVVKGVTMWVDYVEFEDKTTQGPDRAGSRIIANIREGAAKYKEWLIQKYNQSGRSIDAIVPLLEQSQPLPEELGIQNGNQQEGARFYRSYALKTYETKGAAGLIKYLK